MATILVKHETVLPRLYPVGDTTELVIFRAEGGAGTDVALDRATWDDMGRPDVVTVTVVPGDTLNG